MTMQPIELPLPGQRVGIVAEPGQSPKDSAGTVICQFADRSGAQALVMMDYGKVMYCYGIRREPGIGWHILSENKP